MYCKSLCRTACEYRLQLYMRYYYYSDIVFQVSVPIVEGQRELLHAVRVATRLQDFAENIDSVHRRVVYPFRQVSRATTSIVD